MAEQIKKRFLRLAVPTIDDPLAVALADEHNPYTVEQIINQLAADHQDAGRVGEAKSILALKAQNLVINGNAIPLNTRIGDLPFTMTTTKDGQILLAQLDVDTTHVMG